MKNGQTYRQIGPTNYDSSLETKKTKFLNFHWNGVYLLQLLPHSGQAKLVISAHLISISDDKLGPRSGIIISLEPTC